MKGDHGTDVNLIPPTVLDQILKSKPRMKVEDLMEPLSYGALVTNGPKVTCRRKVKNSIMLHVRHGTTLALRNMEWMVSDDNADMVLIGEHVLRAVGLDNRTFLKDACDRHGGAIDIAVLVEKFKDGEQNCDKGTIRSLIRASSVQIGSTFHRDSGGDDEGMEDSDVYVDLEDNPIDAIRAQMAERFKETRSAGIPERGAKR